MSCVLRISSPTIASVLEGFELKPYRVEQQTAHFNVSGCDFDNLSGQVSEAELFLQAHGRALKKILGESHSSGELDFAVEHSHTAFKFNHFPATFISLLSDTGLALTLSHYPSNS